MIINIRILQLIWLASLFLIPRIAFPQEKQIRFEQINSENGLPQNTIHGIAKDKFGFMWFGTWSGLCRYDGYKIKVYRYDPANPKSIVNDRIHNIVIDQKGDLWIGTFLEDVYCRYDYIHDNFKRINVDRAPPPIKKALNHRFHYLNTSYIFNGFRWSMKRSINGLMKTNLKDGKVSRVIPDPDNRWSLNDGYVTDIYLGYCYLRNICPLPLLIQLLCYY